MAKCPWCGSEAQVEVLATEYIENGWEMEVLRHCECGCGTTFVAKSWYKSDGCEDVEVEMRYRRRG